MDASLRRAVESWIAQDPDPSTREELSQLLGRGAGAELAERFSGELEFGTAGLRGILGGGPMRMNRAVVRRASAGLASYLLSSMPDAARRGVVVGYDGRRMSREFAEEAARAICGAGLDVYLFEHLCPTPLTAFAVKQLRAAAGVMVTASHNPPEYNGYKVYWDNGAQIIPPVDKGISTAIAKVGDLRELPMPSLAEARESGQLQLLGEDMERRYLAAIKELVLRPEIGRNLTIVYTPMHGVGGKLAMQALSQAGFTLVHKVAAQFEPDGAFPTVRFPNPEEKGAMDLSLALAREKDAELVIANDPDADRLAIAVRRGPGDYLQLTGDQVGALLGYFLLTERKAERERLVVTTVVSSTLLGQMAKELGVRYAQTLTGFKWIANRAIALEKESKVDFVMGYEEALGYCISTIVRDKDGISAAAVFAELAAICKSRGKTVLQYLEEIYRRFGYFKSLQHSLVLPGASGAAQIQQIMKRLRSSPPAAIGKTRVLSTTDLSVGIKRSSAGEEKVDLPPSDVLVFELEGAGRIIARPSGTEPKAKFYLELREAIAAAESFEAAQRRADERAQALLRDFLALAQP